MIGVTERTVGGWERRKQKSNVKFDHIEDLSEVTGIPMRVLIYLATGHPIYYCIRKRRIIESIVEKDKYTDFPLPALVGQEVGIHAIFHPINKQKQVDAILNYDHSIYPTSHGLRGEIILESAERLPELNHFLCDAYGHYAGHLICIPLRREIYEKIRSQTMSEGEINISHLALKGEDGLFPVYYIYSLYSSHITQAYQLFYKALSYLRRISKNGESLVGGYVVTEEAYNLATKIGMDLIFASEEEHSLYGTEIVPSHFECPLSHFRHRKLIAD